MYQEENYYFIVRDFQIENVGLIFFSKSNVDKIQEKIKEIILETLNVKLTSDQNTESLLMVMRYIYLQEGRFLKYKINEQVENLNNKLLELIIPDISTGVKQQLGYIKYINEPLNPIDRPFNDSIKGSKLPRANLRFF